MSPRPDCIELLWLPRTIEKQRIQQITFRIYHYWLRDTDRALTRDGNVHFKWCGCHRDSFDGTQIAGPDCDQISFFTLLYISSTVSPWTTPVQQIRDESRVIRLSQHLNVKQASPVKYSPNSCSIFSARSNVFFACSSVMRRFNSLQFVYKFFKELHHGTLPFTDEHT